MQTKHFAVQGNLRMESSEQKIAAGVFAFAVQVKCCGISYCGNGFGGSP